MIVLETIHKICISKDSKGPVPLGKGSAVTLNFVSKSKLKVMAEICEKSFSGAYFLSLWSNLAQTLLTESLWSKNVQ